LFEAWEVFAIRAAFPLSRELSGLHQHTFRSQLWRVLKRMAVWLHVNSDWEELAEAANYRAKYLAACRGISLRKLERDFLAQTGKSPQQWLNDLRLRKAPGLIAHGLSMKEVAFRLGFKQLSHFSREFKRFHGVPPTGIFPPNPPAVARR
jgi:AraC-like DNA-binding protein